MDSRTSRSCAFGACFPPASPWDVYLPVLSTKMETSKPVNSSVKEAVGPRVPRVEGHDSVTDRTLPRACYYILAMQRVMGGRSAWSTGNNCGSAVRSEGHHSLETTRGLQETRLK